MSKEQTNALRRTELNSQMRASPAALQDLIPIRELL